ncbi:hypothetical protein CR513_23967, partial [Mucuna pruriens]
MIGIELQGSIESHMNKILEETKKKVNLNHDVESSQREQKVRVMIISIMEEKKIIEVEVEDITEEEDMTISIKEETTISYHTIKKEVEIILVLPIKEEDVNFDNPQSLFLVIIIRLKDDSQNFIFDVFYAYSFHHNILSIGQLLEKGYNIKEYVFNLLVVNIPNGVYETYEIGKNLGGKKKLLEIIYSYLFTIVILAHVGNKYFITFIEEFSRKT